MEIVFVISVIIISGMLVVISIRNQSRKQEGRQQDNINAPIINAPIVTTIEVKTEKEPGSALIPPVGTTHHKKKYAKEKYVKKKYDKTKPDAMNVLSTKSDKDKVEVKPIESDRMKKPKTATKVAEEQKSKTTVSVIKVTNQQTEQEESELFLNWIDQKGISSKMISQKENNTPLTKQNEGHLSHASLRSSGGRKASGSGSKEDSQQKEILQFVQRHRLSNSIRSCIVTLTVSEMTIEATLDFHGFTLEQVRKMLRELLGIRCRQEIHLKCIHGYTQGTVIRDYLRKGLTSPRIKETFNYSTNDGQTELIFSALQ